MHNHEGYQKCEEKARARAAAAAAAGEEAK
jgi:hypothetical protein